MLVKGKIVFYDYSFPARMLPGAGTAVCCGHRMNFNKKKAYSENFLFLYSLGVQPKIFLKSREK